MKQGKEITLFEIRKRLNTMGVTYDSEQIAKDYYVKLYDKAIQEESKRKKIETDLENDLIYSSKKRKNIYKIQKTELLNIKNNFEYESVNSNTSDDEFLSKDFKEATILLHLGYNIMKPIYDKEPIVKSYVQKIFFPIQAVKKYATLRLLPFIKNFINDTIDKISKIDFLDINIIYTLLNLLLFFVFIYFIYRIYKRKNKSEKNVIE